MSEEIQPKSYAIAWVSLLVLAGASLGLSHVSLGMWGAPVAIAIAAVKAIIVASVFMHLIRGSTSQRLVVGAALTLVAILTLFVMVDVVSREETALTPPSVPPPHLAAAVPSPQAAPSPQPSPRAVPSPQPSPAAGEGADYAARPDLN